MLRVHQWCPKDKAHRSRRSGAAFTRASHSSKRRASLGRYAPQHVGGIAPEVLEVTDGGSETDLGAKLVYQLPHLGSKVLGGVGPGHVDIECRVRERNAPSSARGSAPALPTTAPCTERRQRPW